MHVRDTCTSYNLWCLHKHYMKGTKTSHVRVHIRYTIMRGCIAYVHVHNVQCHVFNTHKKVL